MKDGVSALKKTAMTLAKARYKAKRAIDGISFGDISWIDPLAAVRQFGFYRTPPLRQSIVLTVHGPARSDTVSRRAIGAATRRSSC